MNTIIEIISFHEKKPAGGGGVVVKSHSSHSRRSVLEGGKNDIHDFFLRSQSLKRRHFGSKDLRPLETEYIIKKQEEESEQFSHYEMQEVVGKSRDRQLVVRGLEDELALIEHRFDDVQWVEEVEQSSCHEQVEELYKGIQYFNDDDDVSKQVDQQQESPPPSSRSCNVRRLRRCSSKESLFSYTVGEMILDFENHEEDVENGLLVDFPTQRWPPSFAA